MCILMGQKDPILSMGDPKGVEDVKKFADVYFTAHTFLCNVIKL
jgi:hypothetical protein